jgi:tetratricopeptide (TPR) repeat protein
VGGGGRNLAGGRVDRDGLATPNRYNHLTLNPALCPYLRGRMDAAEREALTARWVEAMRAYVEFLVQQRSQNAEVAATLTGLELPNLFALLDLVQRAGDAEATIGLATSLYSLLKMPASRGCWSAWGRCATPRRRRWATPGTHARFEAARTRIEQQLGGGTVARGVRRRAAIAPARPAAGEQAYPEADYDLAMACFLLARVLQMGGGPEQALPLLDEARQRFEAIAKERPERAAEGMASKSASRNKAIVFCNLGRLDEAAAAYEENIHRAEQLGDARQVAVGKGPAWVRPPTSAPLPGGAGGVCRSARAFTQLDEPGPSR